MGDYTEIKKVPLSLVDPKFIEGIAWAEHSGGERHKSHHWRDGVSVVAILDGLKRHIAAIEEGEYFDNGEGGSNLQHAYHAACGLEYIAYYVRHKALYEQCFDQPYRRHAIDSSSVGEPNNSGEEDPRDFGKAPR